MIAWKQKYCQRITSSKALDCSGFMGKSFHILKMQMKQSNSKYGEHMSLKVSWYFETPMYQNEAVIGNTCYNILELNKSYDLGPLLPRGDMGLNHG